MTIAMSQIEVSGGMESDSVFNLEFCQNVMNELLFAAILIAAYFVGKHQSKAHATPKWAQKKIDVPGTMQKLSSEDLGNSIGKKFVVDNKLVKGMPFSQAEAPATRARRMATHDDAKDVAKKLDRGLQGRKAEALEENHCALKLAIRQQNFDNALQQFAVLHSPTLPDGVSEAIPQSLREAVIMMASQHNKLDALMDVLRGSKVTARTLNAMLKDCARRGNSAELQACKNFGHELNVPFNCATYIILLGGAESSQDACAVLEEASASGARMGRLCEVAAERAENEHDSALAKLILRHLPQNTPVSAQTVAAILHQRAKAVAAEDTRSMAVDAAVMEVYSEHFTNVDVSVCPRAHQIVLDTAIRAGKSEVVAALVGAEGGAVALRAAANGTEAMRIFEACSNKTPCLYQVLIDVLLRHGEVDATDKLLNDAAKSGFADTALYLGVCEAQLRCGSLNKARGTIAAMRDVGLQPTSKVLNAWLEESLKHGTKDVWGVVREMEACGVKPDNETCRILLEYTQRRPEQLETVVTMAEGLEDPTDVFGSLLETCLRCGKARLLGSHLKRQRGPNRVLVKDAITYAHLVRAFGAVEDIDGAWDAWKEMRARNIMPLKVTLGCMVQALVVNRQPLAGYELVKEMRLTPRTKCLVNSVTCNSLIKGFGYEKDFDRAWSVFTEMRGDKMELTIMTFNTLIDACARSNGMSRLPTILEEMTAHGIELDQITYNTIIKGLCHEKRLEQALGLRAKMREDGKHVADAHAYAALLDGCSRLGKFQLGFDLLEEMLQEGIKPNNVMLTSLVRLAGHSHKAWALDRAFKLVGELPRKHGIRSNLHVYKNLAKACAAHGEPMRALGVVAQAARDGLRCDEGTYAPIITALTAQRSTLVDAVHVLRVAAGLRICEDAANCEASAALAGVPFQNLRMQGGLSAQGAADLLKAIAAIDQASAVGLVVQLEREAGVQLDRLTKLRLASGQ